MYYTYCKYTKDLHKVDVLVNSIIINSSIINTGGVICESLLLDVQRPQHIITFISLSFRLYVHIYVRTVCSGKIVLFHNLLQPLPRLHRCRRPSKLSTQCECTVSPIGWYFFVQPIAADCWRGRGGKLLRILGKKHNI